MSKKREEFMLSLFKSISLLKMEVETDWRCWDFSYSNLAPKGRGRVAIIYLMHYLTFSICNVMEINTMTNISLNDAEL